MRLQAVLFLSLCINSMYLQTSAQNVQKQSGNQTGIRQHKLTPITLQSERAFITGIRNHVLSHPGFWGHAGPVRLCQPPSANSHTQMAVILDLHFCVTSVFIFKFAKALDRAGPQETLPSVQSRFQSGRLSSATKQCCQRAAAKCSDTQLWQPARQLFGSLPLFWKSTTTGKR